MEDLSIDVIIDGDHYSHNQLERLNYERALHVLHEMKRLGAAIVDGGSELSDAQIDWLECADAVRVLLETKQRLGNEGILDLYRDVLADSDARWRLWASDYDPACAHTGVTEIAIRGISMQETVAVLGNASDPTMVYRTFAEHFLGEGAIATGQYIVETFGMLGEPTYVHGVASRGEIPEDIPVEPDSSYAMRLIGETLLASDDTNIHVGAVHEIRPVENGLDFKSTFFCPGKAPASIAEGHKLHFAIELSNSARIAYEAVAKASN